MSTLWWKDFTGWELLQLGLIMQVVNLVIWIGWKVLAGLLKSMWGD